MKKVILMALAFAPFISQAQNNNFTVTGKIAKPEPNSKIYLNYILNGKSVIDSAAIVNGGFQFKGPAAEPGKAALLLDHKGVGMAKLQRNDYDVLELYLAQENITVKATDSIKNAVISNSKINEEKAKYTAQFAKQDKDMAAILQEYNAADAKMHEDARFEEDHKTRYAKAADDKKALMETYIKQNPASYFSLAALAEIAGPDTDPATLEPLYKVLSPQLQNSATGRTLAQTINAAKLTAVGATAPDFTQNDVNDKPVKLSDFKGKYVLLDFWASWCGPCRAENPNVVKAFQQYKDKNFTVLGVSLDQPGKKDAWLAAIKADGLEWTQVSDLKFWENEVARQYGIRSIPQNYLIDPQGKIVGKNLRGEELDKKLASLIH